MFQTFFMDSDDHSGSGIGASFGFHQSPLPLVALPTLAQVLPPGFTKALFLRLHLALWRRCFTWESMEPFFVCVSSWILVLRLFDFVSTLVLVAQCTFLHNLLMLNISFGCCRHSVSNTVVQLTEGRSAPDKPKQLPAKKKTNHSTLNGTLPWHPNGTTSTAPFLSCHV